MRKILDSPTGLRIKKQFSFKEVNSYAAVQANNVIREIGETLRPPQEAANLLSEALLEGRASFCPFTPFVTPKLPAAPCGRDREKPSTAKLGKYSFSEYWSVRTSLSPLHRSRRRRGAMLTDLAHFYELSVAPRKIGEYGVADLARKRGGLEITKDELDTLNGDRLYQCTSDRGQS